MTHQIDHEDLTTRPWVCTRCGCNCLSKNPWRRNTHGEGPGGMLNAMYLGSLRSVSTVRMVPAHPPRPKEEEFVYLASSPIVERDAPFCRINHEQDVAIYLTPDNSVSDTGKPLKTAADALNEFFKVIREAKPSVVRAYVCAETVGHDWTDDPEELKKWRDLRQQEEGETSADD